MRTRKSGVLFLFLILLTTRFCLAAPVPVLFDRQFGRILSNASESELYRFFHEMPKGGILHLHSEYAVPPEFWFKIATTASILKGNEYFTKVSETSCPGNNPHPILFATVQRSTWERLAPCEKGAFKPLASLSADEQRAWLTAVTVNNPVGGRAKFFQGVVPRLDELWQDPNLMLEVIPQIVQQAASEHVSYLEVQFDPTSLHDAAGRPVSPDLFIESLEKRLSRPDVVRAGITLRFQMAAYRYASDPRKELLNAFSFVDRHRDLWVGVNLLGEEGLPGGELSRFAPALREMRAKYDISFSLHAGELDVPGQQVREALIAGASRIGHAVNLIDDPDTFLLMRGMHVPIEVSLVSNKLLEYTPDLSTHPFPLYLRSGIPLCLNTDDPGAWYGSLTDEFFLAEKYYRLSWREIVGLAENSLAYSFPDKPTKARLLSQLDSDLSNFEARLSSDQWRVWLRRKPSEMSGFAKKYLHTAAF